MYNGSPGKLFEVVPAKLSSRSVNNKNDCYDDTIGRYFPVLTRKQEGIDLRSSNPQNKNRNIVSMVGFHSDSLKYRIHSNLFFPSQMWGLVPFWAVQETKQNPCINARSETLKEKKMFKNLLAKNRCVIICEGYSSLPSIDIIILFLSSSY